MIEIDVKELTRRYCMICNYLMTSKGVNSRQLKVIDNTGRKVKNSNYMKIVKCTRYRQDFCF